ncbi:MAG: hypothetical protein A2Y41_03340 [Spirochaetes bacterium GWB1_36_13]|nr:MAG: hypothetical protein A2Y41_03340 [Spirochaetes bacterium GWB1_36_13]
MARPLNTKKTVSVPIRFPEEWINELKNISQDLGLSAYIEVIRIAVKKYLDEYHEDYGLAIAIKEGLESEKIDTEAFLNSLKKRAL